MTATVCYAFRPYTASSILKKIGGNVSHLLNSKLCKPPLGLKFENHQFNEQKVDSKVLECNRESMCFWKMKISTLEYNAVFLIKTHSILYEIPTLVLIYAAVVQL